MDKPEPCPYCAGYGRIYFAATGTYADCECQTASATPEPAAPQDGAPDTIFIPRIWQKIEGTGYSYLCGDWSTETGHFPMIAYTRHDLHADELAKQSARIQELVAALTRIEKWEGEFPITGKTWEGSGNPMSYAACFGSNGERDYMRDVARKALPPAPKPQEGA